MIDKAVTRQNHYVPIWYQKGFILEPATSLYYLDLKPATSTLADGRVIVQKAISQRTPKGCFWAEDLYTTRFGSWINDEVEKYLFGAIDNDGANAVRAYANNDAAGMHRWFKTFFEYLDAQKLRTPKGLDWIKSKYPRLSQVDLMIEMQHLRQMHCTMWLEGVREIVSAEESDVKFIVSDDPVVFYNAAFPPDSAACPYPDDPALELKGTQTLFALDGNHCLILSNLEYAKNSTQTDLTSLRTNPRYYGQTIARTDALVRSRKLTRSEVISINYLLKARARKYVAACDKSWLYPEKDCGGDIWRAIGKVLLPPADELWHFGGEMYIGFKDGTTQYQDAFGRSSGSHEYLKKKPEKRIGRNDPCGCGSGRKFKKCCEPLPADRRPPWDTYSVRERNIIFIRAVTDLLGFNIGKTWDDLRRDLSDEQVKRIHELVQMLWPKDTDIAVLLPRADDRVFRAVYMGPVDPRTIAPNVISWLVYFDEVIVISPFVNANYIRPKYSPIESPAQYKEQTLKNLMLLFSLEPFIHAGVVHMLPDPGEFNAEFREALWDMAKSRTENWKPSATDLEQFRNLAEDDFERSTRRLSAESLRSMVLRHVPELTPEKVDRLVEYMKQQQKEDPLSLLQPIQDGGELVMTRSVNLELALFFAQMTGSTIYTDVPLLWKHLHEHTSAIDPKKGLPAWAVLSEVAGGFELTLEANPQINFEILSTGTLSSLRNVLRRIWNSIELERSGAACAKTAGQLAIDLRQALPKSINEWDRVNCKGLHSLRFRRRIELSIPQFAFERQSVRRLLLTFGRSKQIRAMPMAMLVKPSPADSDAKQQPNDNL